MKNSVTLILMMLMTATCADLMGQTLDPKSVIAVNEIELRDDVDTLEFEKFVLSKFAPIYNEIEGQQFTLVKGDRGKRKNKYAVILQFDSVEDRNRIYPEKGKSTVKWGGTPEIWKKFTDMAIDPYADHRGTNYLIVKH